MALINAVFNRSICTDQLRNQNCNFLITTLGMEFHEGKFVVCFSPIPPLMEWNCKKGIQSLEKSKEMNAYI